jgi:hypothetical protein
MSFDIKLTDEAVPDLKTGDSAVFGEIMLGDFTERFYASTTYWLKSNYYKQWEYAVRSIVDGPDNAKAGLITCMYDPQNANFIHCWPMFREGDRVHFRNNLLFLEDLPKPFDVDKVASYIGDHATTSDDVTKPSEWVIEISDLKDWLRKLEKAQDN